MRTSSGQIHISLIGSAMKDHQAMIRFTSACILLLSLVWAVDARGMGSSPVYSAAASAAGVGRIYLPVKTLLFDPCRSRYRCKSLLVRVCMAKGTDKPFAKSVPSARCTAFEYYVSFVAAYNGHRVWVDRGRVRCPFAAAHVKLSIACPVIDDGGIPSGNAGVQSIITADLGNGHLYETYVNVLLDRHGRPIACADYLKGYHS